MASQTTIIVAIGIALLLIAALFGLASKSIGLGGDAINNFSNRADSGDEDPSFASLDEDEENNKVEKVSEVSSYA